ncbi:MAG TPA: SagB/ThcOx family dehydrogenase [Bacteroidales bacterium]|nr:SagB/ThcOx family dehydrogenase [Bacteroidales bacterium]HSA44408.1 SagB/ThcOx family dehydrogenase [Bacteroidales bacterium]
MRFFLALILLPVFSQGQELNEIQLPPPQTSGGIPLMDALRERHSSREFSARKPDLQTLSDLLWAADGFNRPTEQKRTAPSSMNYQEIDIYLAMEDGLYLWDAVTNKLKPVVRRDIREHTGKQDFVKTAGLNLVYVADFARCRDGKTEHQVHASHINSGFIAQNVYLFCASRGLNTVVRAYFDAGLLAKAMGLTENQFVILTQTVGFPPGE